ncbi:putative phospholipase [Helianthus debilis subsp. tardiflorus]
MRLQCRLEHTLPDTVRVHDYNVKQSVALVLEAIINKHGDIAAKCVFKAASVRASLLELVCDIVKQLEPKTDGVIDIMEEIENQVSSVEKANVNVSWLQAHLEAINKTNDGKTGLLTG